MNSTPSEHDPALRRLLREWTPAAELPPRFADRVWQRIAAAESGARATIWELLRQWTEARLRRPAVALAYVCVLLGLGVTSGYLHGRSDAARQQGEQQARYLRSVDPFQH